MIYQSGDAELFYASRGDGPNLVMLHPTPVNHEFWLPLADTMAGYHLLLPDLRGHGRSQLGAGPLSMSVLAEDVVQLLDRLEIEKAFFCGCSIGGYVLYELWRRAPERIAALAIFCAKPQPDTPANKAKRKETIDQIRTHGTDAFFEAMSQSLLGSTSKRRNASLLAKAREMMTMEPEAVTAVQKALGERPDSVPTARTISVPLLVVAGGEDASSTPAEMEVLAQSARNAEFHLMMDAGHFAALEQPERAGGLLRTFLDRCSS